MGRGYSPYIKQRISRSNIYEREINLPFPFKGEDDLEVNVGFEWEPAERQTRLDPGTDERAVPVSVILLDNEFNRSEGSDKVLEPYYGKDIVELLSEEQLDRLEEDFLTSEDVYIPERDYAPEPEDVYGEDR